MVVKPYGYYTENSCDDSMVKRLNCDCCEAFYDFILTPENKDVEITFVCHPCEESILKDNSVVCVNDMPERTPEEVEKHYTENPDDYTLEYRFDKTELISMRKALDDFKDKNIVLISECTDFYPLEPVSEKEIVAFLEKHKNLKKDKIFNLSGTLTGIVKSGASREVKLDEEENFYKDEHGNTWGKINGYSNNDMAVWKLDISSLKSL